MSAELSKHHDQGMLSKTALFREIFFINLASAASFSVWPLRESGLVNYQSAIL
jgi:hypothetical protein